MLAERRTRGFTLIEIEDEMTHEEEMKTEKTMNRRNAILDDYVDETGQGTVRWVWFENSPSLDLSALVRAITSLIALLVLVVIYPTMLTPAAMNHIFSTVEGCASNNANGDAPLPPPSSPSSSHENTGLDTPGVGGLVVGSGRRLQSTTLLCGSGGFPFRPVSSSWWVIFATTAVSCLLLTVYMAYPFGGNLKLMTFLRPLLTLYLTLALLGAVTLSGGSGVSGHRTSLFNASDLHGFGSASLLFGYLVSAISTVVLLIMATAVEVQAVADGWTRPNTVRGR